MLRRKKKRTAGKKTCSAEPAASQRVGRSLCRCLPTGVYYARRVVAGKKIHQRRRTNDRVPAKRRLAEVRNELARTDHPTGFPTLGWQVDHDKPPGRTRALALWRGSAASPTGSNAAGPATRTHGPRKRLARAHQRGRPRRRRHPGVGGGRSLSAEPFLAMVGPRTKTGRRSGPPQSETFCL